MNTTVWFDCDGTIANLYDVPDWLSKLRAADPSPYAEAGVMHNMSLLARYLNKIQAAGYNIGIISWLAMGSTADYDKAVTEAKLEWLNKHLHSVCFDEIHIVDYGTPKQDFMHTDDDILFDDNWNIRNEWEGRAYKPDDILRVLKELAV